MGLIKSINAPPALAPFSMRDIESQAQAMLLRARQAAERLLVEAQKEAEVLKDQATAQGYAEGHREGTAKGLNDGRKSGHDGALAEYKEKFSLVWTALTAMVKELEAVRLDLEAAGLTEVVQLASSIARRVTKRQAMIDPGVLLENIHAAMKLAVAAADVRIVIHPEQRKTLLEELPKLQMNWPNLKHVELVDDAAVSPGGCRILTKQGEVDAEIDGQLDRVIGELLPGVKT